jgi:hypothetical protein
VRILFFKLLFIGGLIGLNLSLTDLRQSAWMGMAVGLCCFTLLIGLDGILKPDNTVTARARSVEEWVPPLVRARGED